MPEVRRLTHVAAKEVLHPVKHGDCFLLANSPVIVLEILGDIFKGGILHNARDFFEVPRQSSRLGIWQCDPFRRGTRMWRLVDLHNKIQCLKLNYKHGHVILPPLHLH